MKEPHLLLFLSITISTTYILYYLILFLFKSTLSNRKYKRMALNNKLINDILLSHYLKCRQNSYTPQEKYKSITSTEIVELLKSEGRFICEFNKSYPGFTKRIIAINPSISKSEIILAAMIRLGFSNKEIAKYTYVEEKTVHTKKYRLKKKLGIQSNLDINQFIQSISV
ncbi:hypothetical protein EG346_21155 [Chryseobacterium carnipullorum]|uniref:DNA-binding transcriptional activator EvgA n=1 Tax=Chryseobacterium carnipullorum TaxID=1124835 RepID=A0A376E1P3_CHRCU|nr:LuxR C-terminal-related transcriptional regulator [Chryseobacterium carnipullorum]AZA50534.1 hypothetical protein EG346_21155 [Chryseobacterium carnipullorum]AZA65399.1 hypothetical protein EG345_12225 [Chryseobacterium carnipullorum]STD00289.1 DNA-binding transcriptional activator EvgA [Chryseobacterium carnipullorum]